MSKKDYVNVAEIIKARKEYLEKLNAILKTELLDVEIYEVVYFALQMADMFQKDNPKFSRQKFLSACGVENES